MVDQKLVVVLGTGGIVALLIVGFAFFFLRETPVLFSTLTIIAVLVLLTPLGLMKYAELQKIQQLEESFPQFISDLVESVRSGMTLPQAIKSLSENDYGALTPYVTKLNAQLDWGVPFSKAFMGFTRSTKSRLIGRIGSTIIESHEFGGNLTDIFESISKSTMEIERLREERKLYLNSQLISGYIIFFVFLIVLIGLQKFLVPALSNVQPIGEETAQLIPTDVLEQEYKTIFRNLIILQGIFAGLVIGKMSEGAVVAGLKHSAVMIVAGIVVFSLATF